MTTTRLEWVDYAKGIGIILVVYGHVVGGAQTGNIKIYDMFAISREVIYHFHMPLFFFLSGLFVSHSYLQRGEKGFIYNKVKVLIYPYFLWSVLQCIILVIVSKYTYLDYSLYSILSILYKPMLHYWFLYALFLMYITYLFSIRLNSFSLPVIVMLSMLLYFYPINTTYLSLGNYCKFLIFFVAGIVWQKQVIDLKIERKLSIFSTILLVLIFIGSEMFIKNIYSSYFLLFLSAFIGILMTILISKHFAKNRVFTLLKCIGIYSMPIYLAHGFGGSGARILMYDFWGLRNQVLLIGASTMIGVFGPIFVYRASVKLGFPYLFELKH